MIYLGADIEKYQVKSGKYHWIMSITQLMKNTIKMLERLFKDEDRQLINVKSAGNQPLLNRYWPELEQSNDMSP